MHLVFCERCKFLKLRGTEIDVCHLRALRYLRSEPTAGAYCDGQAATPGQYLSGNVLTEVPCGSEYCDGCHVRPS